MDRWRTANRRVWNGGDIVTKIDCKYWSAGVKFGGRCSLGLFGGRPSRGICAGCSRREPAVESVPAKRVAVDDDERKRRAHEAFLNKWAAQGPKMWRELHEYALTVTDLATAVVWLEGFATRIGCGKCQSHWRELVKANPPTLPLFDWTVARHNDVNLRLGKSVMRVEEARTTLSASRPLASLSPSAASQLQSTQTS
jgi:hypothetical protein